MRKTLFVVVFFVSNISLLVASFFLMSMSKFANHTTTHISANYGVSYSSVPEVLGTFSTAQIKEADARPGIVDNFLAKYDSPFKGLGQFIVNSADKYNIHYGLIPAIAQCESNVGKIIPPGSYNAWGWNIYGNNKHGFNDWFEAIDRVSRSLREDYYNYGLNTPEKIMPKYTPPSKGSWSRCVNHFIAQMQ